MNTLADEQIAAQAKAELDAVIEQLYEVFAKYELKEHVKGCPHCVEDKDHKRLHSKPLRNLSGDDIDRYAFKAMTTWGDKEDFKHFLPRIFELAAYNDFFLPNKQVVFGKVRHAGGHIDSGKWPTEEASSLEKYFWALWNYQLQNSEESYLTESRYFDFEEVLRAISGVKENLQPFLEQWLEVDTLRANVTLWKFLELNLDPIERTGSFKLQSWTYSDMDKISTWLKNPATLAALKDKFAKEADEQKKEYLYKSVELLQVFQDLQSA